VASERKQELKMTISKSVEEMAEQLIEGETEKLEEEKATLTVESNETTQLKADYDMVEVLHYNLTQNIEHSKKIIPMLSKKEAHKVLTKLMESGIVDQKDSKYKLKSNLAVNAFEICNQVEMDKRGLVLKVQEQAMLGLPDLMEKMEQEKENDNNEETGESNE
jgi:hypothetical protein